MKVRQYTVGIPGIGVKFEAEEVHAAVGRTWNQAKELTTKLVKQSKPVALSAADTTLRYTVIGVRYAADGVVIAADVLQGLRDKVQSKLKFSQLFE